MAQLVQRRTAIVEWVECWTAIVQLAERRNAIVQWVECWTAIAQLVERRTAIAQLISESDRDSSVGNVSD